MRQDHCSGIRSYGITASLGVLTQWLERDCRETPAETADIIITLLFHTPGRDC
ncbi:MAG: TetR family transcriptional regulator C-terminal domain-containing protein [Solobacterium sp.]|nr:TetR family transcriptional regulator C-terminal domain-containing protein [Solobacterium sp.]